MIEATCRFILRHIALSRFTRRERAPGARWPLLPCNSRAASVLVSVPTQHFGYVANSRSRFPIIQSRNATSAWRALRRAASPLAASRHRLRLRRTCTWPRCCCTAARQGAASVWCRGAVHRLCNMAHCFSLISAVDVLRYFATSFPADGWWKCNAHGAFECARLPACGRAQQLLDAKLQRTALVWDVLTSAARSDARWASGMVTHAV